MVSVFHMNRNNIHQAVVVRDFMGRGFVRRVWELAGNIVFITSEEGIKKLSNGEENLWPIGIPIEDVYEYDGKPLPEKVNWKQMTHWMPKA